MQAFGYFFEKNATYQKKYPALYAIFNSREDRSTTFSDIYKLFFAFCPKWPKMIQKFS